MAYHDISHWIDIFETRGQQTPTDIVLPGFVESGASYNSAFALANDRLGGQNTLGQWVRDSKEAVNKVAVWATIVPTLPKLANDLNALRDQWDEPMEDACIVNTTVQSILAKLFVELRQLEVDGVVLDLTDVYPNSTSSRYPFKFSSQKNELRPLQNTCFCRFCIEGLKREAKWTEGTAPFRPVERNLARFVLKPTETGATPIDVRDHWLEKLDAPELVDFSAARGFIGEEDDEGRQDALKLLKYLDGRGKVTAGAVKRLHESAGEAGLRLAVVMGSALYDMSQNTSLTYLMKINGADEYWAPSFEPSHLEKGEPPRLRFLATRASYYFNALFVQLDSLSQAGRLEFQERVIKAAGGNASALSERNEFTIGQCAQIQFYPGIDGFVGVPFDKADFIDLISKKSADGSLPERMKMDLLSLVESGPSLLSATAETHSTDSKIFG